MRHNGIRYIITGLLLFLVSIGTLTAEDSEPQMIFVDGGTFWMGSNEAAYMPTELAHQVEISPFYISETEITQEVWTSVMGTNPSRFRGSLRPVETVSWFDAVRFCNTLSEKEGLEKVYNFSGSHVLCDWSANGYRLPTEAEWEYASRGGSNKAVQEEALSRAYYSGSQNASSVAWFRMV